MSAPRITLWTKPFQMAFRLSIRPFYDTYLDEQADAIQKSGYRYITITPGTLYILSSIAGRRMTEPARWILFDSLRDILNGNLRTQYPEKQDLLASTLGELLGVILLTQNLGGNVEIIRLLESGPSKMPDFLLIETTNAPQTIHVLECKGRVEDVRNINNRTTEYDLCQEIRGFRDAAIEQIQEMDFSRIKFGTKTVIQHSKHPFGISQLAATENVIVSSIPDARIINRCRSSVKFASRKKCSPKVTCKMCITSLKNPDQANVISVLHQRQTTNTSKSGRWLIPFVARYRSVQRAAWSGNDALFEIFLNNFISRLSNNYIQDMLPTAIFMTVTLIEAAISEELTQAHLNTQVLSTIAPEWMQDIIKNVEMDFSRTRDTTRKQTINIEMPDFTNIASFSDTILPVNLPSLEDDNGQQDRERNRLLEAQSVENLQRGTMNQSISQILDLVKGTYTTTKLLIGTTIQNDYLYGSIQYEDDFIIIIRLISVRMNYITLKYYAEQIITQLRPPYVKPVTWRSEYFQENSKRKFFVGESWDEFPYPNPANKAFPGITAWLARDGRAEIIVRKRM